MPWMDFSYKSKTKGGFTVYLTVECEQEVQLDISLETEKKKKTKTITFSPPSDGKGPKQKRVAFGGTGRRFRLWLESSGTVPWRITQGIMMVVETDED